MGSDPTKQELKERVCRLEAEIAALKRLHFIDEGTGQIFLKKDGSPPEVGFSAGQYYRLIIENAADLIFTVNEQGDFSYISPNCRNILGYGPEIYTGKNFISFVHPDDAENIMATLSDIFTQYQSFGVAGVNRLILDFRALTRNRDWRWLSASNTLVKESGSHIEVVCIARDITEQKIAAKKLEESEERYRFLVEESNDIIWTFDISTMKFTYASRSVEHILGFTQKTVEGYGLENVFSPSTRKHVLDAFYNAINEKNGTGRVLMEAEHLKKDKSRVWMEISAVLHRDDSGDPLYFTGISRDITLRKRSEEALQKSEEKYRTILETIEDGYFEVDLAGNFVFYNSAMCRMLGYKGNELIGVNYSTYMNPEQKKAVFRAFNGVYQTGKPYKALDWELIRKDKTICYNETSVSLVLDANGRAIGFQGMARDVTERRLAEKENEKLQARLSHAKHMEAIGRLAGGIAHDFNNILTTVLGYTELSMDEVEKQSLVHQNLSQVMAAGTRAKNLVKQILAVSRREKEAFKPVEVAPFIREFLQRTARSVPESIELCEKNSEKDMTVYGDPIQLEQMMASLVKNAVNAMENKGGVLTVAAELFASDEAALMSNSDSPDPDYVRISVSDTGDGIAEELLDKIFEPYFTNKKEGTGTGLGLSLVHGIVRSHKGYIRVESRPGKGSTFYVHFPWVKAGDSAGGL